MNNLTVDDLLSKVAEYNIEGLEMVKKAYYYAEELHKGQKRQSGEDYITHPLNVAYTLAEMYADTDTLCAALLHDTLEDTKITKEQIAIDFNNDVANLVDGVTKISRMNFATKQEQNLANTRKIITSITNDVRIIIIKLADRLHNMRTLQFKSEFKQKENAKETLLLYVPLADRLGMHIIKSELEDLSLKYYNSDAYQRVRDIRMKIDEDTKQCREEMLQTINKVLSDANIPHELKIRTKNIYGIYKRLEQGQKLSDIHDLLALKILVDNVANCYPTLGMVHDKYFPMNNRFKDYIANPKTNLYSSLHTTVFGAEGRLVQIQIRTFEKEKIASYGLTAFWNINKGNARKIMQENLKNKYQFFESLVEIDQTFADNQEFVKHIQQELLSQRVYVYTKKGEIIELPSGSTAIDLAYKIHTELGNKMVGATVNDNPVDCDYILHNKDRVRIITDDLSLGPNIGWLDKVKTTKAKRQIKAYVKK